MDDPVIQAAAATGHTVEIVPCDPELADTAAFCEAYGFDLDQSNHQAFAVPQPMHEPAADQIGCDCTGVARVEGLTKGASEGHGSSIGQSKGVASLFDALSMWLGAARSLRMRPEWPMPCMMPARAADAAARPWQ